MPTWLLSLRCRYSATEPAGEAGGPEDDKIEGACHAVIVSQGRDLPAGLPPQVQSPGPPPPRPQVGCRTHGAGAELRASEDDARVGCLPTNAERPDQTECCR